MPAPTLLEQVAAESLRFAAAYLQGKRAFLVGFVGRENVTLGDSLVKAIEQAEPNSFTFNLVKSSINHTLEGLLAEEKATIPTDIGLAVDWLCGRLIARASALDPAVAK